MTSPAVSLPVSGVSIYPYIPDAPILVPPVFVSAAGNYSVEFLLSFVFYNLSLNSGEAKNGGPHAGGKYYARWKDKDGKEFSTPWMTCIDGGVAPKFGRTVENLPAGAPGNPAALPETSFMSLADVSVDMYIDPIMPLTVPLIKGGSGIVSVSPVILGGGWRAVVKGGERIGPLHANMRVTVGGINAATGQPFQVPATLVTENTGDPAVFGQFPVK